MDKILLVAFLSTFAGFITAVISIVKLVNEKENKTSEFRQAWTNTVRTSFSDLSGKLIEEIMNVEYQERLAEIESKLILKIQDSKGDNYKRRLEAITDLLTEIRKNSSKNRRDLNQSYALCKLHFKPNDKDIIPIEEIIDFVKDKTKLMVEEKDIKKRKEIRTQAIDKTNEIAEIGRTILKKEWERVKEGEKVYKDTKRYSVIGGIIMFIMLLLLGFSSYMQAVNSTENNIESSSKAELKSDLLMCWQLRNFNEKLYKLNSCTGELIELKIDTDTSKK